MKTRVKLLAWVLCLLSAFFICTGFEKQKTEEAALVGAWQRLYDNRQETLLFADGYFSYTSYNKADKRFGETSGGTFTTNDKRLIASIEFNTENKDQVGEKIEYTVSIAGNLLTLGQGEKKTIWTRVDDGNQNLTGTWKITARKQDGAITPIHQTGTRKTLKILSGTRFQWVAINPGTKEFSGTGGGSYTFANGKYTENIEFFSRDSSRVGASLSFDGKIEKDGWHHSGKSSKGDDIYEVWNRIGKKE